MIPHKENNIYQNKCIDTYTYILYVYIFGKSDTE